MELAYIKGINLSIRMHKSLIEETFKPIVQPQRKFTPTMQEVVYKEVLNLFYVGVIYLIFDSAW